ncbi:GNAT family N-acetyltransferase [Leptotrichia sp. HSP-536]|uniref:GNAT family N-acetyltransferase n=1 Tax=Leptotrichia alba TaxID=3239304 RepID=A0AB39V711_9FUSO
MENIVDELTLIHNENFENKVENKYFSEMILNGQYEIYCLFNFGEENNKIIKLKKESNVDNEKVINLRKNNNTEKKILGYIVFYGTIENTDIFEIAIKKEYQGQSFGEKLLKESMEDIVKKNINGNFSKNKFMLEVNEKNVKALKLYEKIGFERISIRKNYYGKNENAMIMMKII